MMECMANSTALASVFQSVAEPVESLVQTVTASRTGRLNVPRPVAQTVETELVCNLGCVHGVRQILLVSEAEQDSVPQFVLVEHAHELITCLVNTFSVITVDNENQTLCVLEVMSPQRSDFVLTTDVPYGETEGR